jgi:hypothetical protein
MRIKPDRVLIEKPMEIMEQPSILMSIILSLLLKQRFGAMAVVKTNSLKLKSG